MQIISIINNPVPSSTYIIVEEGHAIVVDPGSKDCSELIDKLNQIDVQVDYIILTHEHFDHVWGAKTIREIYNTPIVATQTCSEKLKRKQNYFNLLYFGDDTPFYIDDVDIVVSDESVLKWKNFNIVFYYTPGHSSSSMCFSIGSNLFTGDTLMKGFKPVILKRHEGSKEQYKQSVQRIFSQFPGTTMIYPGHGDPFILSSIENEILNYE